MILCSRDKYEVIKGKQIYRLKYIVLEDQLHRQQQLAYVDTSFSNILIEFGRY